MTLVIHVYAERVKPGYAVLRRDVTVDGEPVPEVSGRLGSPAPIDTVRRYERVVRIA